VTGPSCYHYNNKYRYDEVSLAIAVIEKYLVDSKEPVIFLVKNDKIGEKMYVALDTNFPHEILYLPSKEPVNVCEVKTFCKKQKGILITSYETFLGVRARNVVIFLDESSEANARNIVLRAMAFAIVIHNIEDRNIDIPGVNQDYNLDAYCHKQSEDEEMKSHNAGSDFMDNDIKKFII
jgi:hypothetical protein